jgi:transcription-repair coupling factor (superfamily II helicase)
MKKLQDRIFSSSPFESVKTGIEKLSGGQSLRLKGAAGSLPAFIAASLFDKKTQILLLASDNDQAEQFRDDCALLLGENPVKLFGVRPMHESHTLDLKGSINQIETLRALAAQEHTVIVGSAESVVQKLPSPAYLAASMIELQAGSEQPFQRFIRRLEELGFEKKEFVETYGDFAVRGGIIDVFPFAGENPLRCEFWGDALESIREFDVLSQRSIRELQSAIVLPPLQRESGQGTNISGENSILNHSIFDYLDRDTVVILAGPSLIEREIQELNEEGIEHIFDFKYIVSSIGKYPALILSAVGDETVENISVVNDIDLQATPQPSFHGSIGQLVEYLQNLSGKNYTIYLSSDTPQEAERLHDLVEDVLTDPLFSGIDKSTHPVDNIASDRHPPDDRRDTLSALSEHLPVFLSETVHSGFILHAEKIAILTEHEIFGRMKHRGVEKRRRYKGFSQKELQQLKPGDFVVHVDHGIGIFDGLTKLKVGGIEQEVMRLLFLENDVLYVNLNFSNRVQKYSSKEGYTPRLNKLGAADWEKTTKRAKRKLKDIARDIIALYAKRKHEQGFAFSPDTHWQKELEASFMYEDTEDQAGATLVVKQDMESPSPMDRLICGDVGFGKTEVAVRAVFKAVMNGKQAVILVPTTILALQHYNTFQDRLSRYTVRVEHLTRFRSTKEQKRIIEMMNTGGVDVVIGTHRLLSKDISFKDLGLLIIDEEHRFGVAAKEKLRKLKTSVDTLSLTATPIPRTLHFSLIGARDLSLINTPPRNRLPILTEIIPADTLGKQVQWKIVREAILRELHRGGQIYFVHDRVDNIEAIAAQVRTRVPEARVHTAHGQMAGHELEKTMLAFLEKKYDVLVATKIIESGLDIPNVNTIIVNRADRFGLAELYQLRGRVGRSNVQAYAYLLVPPLSVIPRQTLRRLQAIEEFTELGSGFNLAMRDLEIRGAGNLLGAEQSGYIMDMGFEMYERILRDAVDELKREEFTDLFQAAQVKSVPTTPEVVIETDIEAIIPDFYVESDMERLDIYRRIYRATSPTELQSMRNELRDRFGSYPEEVEHLFKLDELRLIASRVSIQKISMRQSSCSITLPPETDEPFYGSSGDDNSPFQNVLNMIVIPAQRTVKLQQEGKNLNMHLTDTGATPEQRLRSVQGILEKILNIVENLQKNSSS